MFNRLKNLVFFMLCCFWLLNTGVVLHAEDSSETAVVRELSYEEKLKIWNSLSDEQKNNLRKRAREMPEKKFNELKNSFEKVKKLEPQEQMRIQNNFRKMRQFNPEQKQKIQQRFKKFQEFPPERKRQFREKFRPGKNHQQGFPQERPMDRNSPMGPGNFGPGQNAANKHPDKNGNRPFQQFQGGNDNQNGFRRDHPGRNFQNPQQRFKNRLQPGNRTNSRHGRGNFSVEERKKRFEEVEKYRNGMTNREKGPDQSENRWQTIKEFRNGAGPDSNTGKREPVRPQNSEGGQELRQPGQRGPGNFRPGPRNPENFQPGQRQPENFRPGPRKPENMPERGPQGSDDSSLRKNLKPDRPQRPIKNRIENRQKPGSKNQRQRPAPRPDK